MSAQTRVVATLVQQCMQDVADKETRVADLEAELAQAEAELEAAQADLNEALNPTGKSWREIAAEDAGIDLYGGP